jgi:hypothetical protein
MEPTCVCGLKLDLWRALLTVFAAQVAVSFHREDTAVVVTQAGGTVGISTPDSMQIVAKRCRQSWWVMR